MSRDWPQNMAHEAERYERAGAVQAVTQSPFEAAREELDDALQRLSKVLDVLEQRLSPALDQDTPVPDLAVRRRDEPHPGGNSLVARTLIGTTDALALAHDRISNLLARLDV